MVGHVTAAVVEPRLADDLREALAAALRRQGGAGSVAVDVQVTEATFEPAAGDGGRVVAWTATLGATFSVSGPAPRAVTLQRSLTTASTGPGADGLPGVRADTFLRLSQVLAEEAVTWLLYAPEGP